MEEKYLHEEEEEVVKNSPFLTKNVLSNPFNLERLRGKETFGRDERLKREKLIEQLFNEGKAIHGNCLTLVYFPVVLNVSYPAQALFSVSKRNFKHAVDRNKLKRIMREAYRRQKFGLYQQLAAQNSQLALGWIYKRKETVDYEAVFKDMEVVLVKLFHSINRKP